MNAAFLEENITALTQGHLDMIEAEASDRGGTLPEYMAEVGQQLLKFATDNPSPLASFAMLGHCVSLHVFNTQGKIP